jgi:hemoglobin-like flavoprotein
MPPTASETGKTLDTKLIQSTYLQIKTQADEFATSFYQILFDKYPNVRPLFAETDMEKQKGKLLESLDLVLVNVHNPKAFHIILKELGKRHVKYGAVLTDYPLVGDALLQALEKHLGKDWTDEARQAWTLAYQTIADTMAEGAKAEMAKDAKLEKTAEKISVHQSPIATDVTPTNKLALSKLITLIFVGMISITGFAVWMLTRPQSSSIPNSGGESQTDRS